ncbi:MAG: hypothetical protein M0Q88_08510 [Bacilli bacterium]|nr:hypothetical protein [Bacilli bacterium]
MTALIFNYSRNDVMVAMDTLGHYPNKQQFIHHTKFYYFKEERVIICGVGIAGLKKDWYEFILYKQINKDILTLDRLATKKLLEFDKLYPNELGATIYQFGYNNRTDEFMGFAYRKSNGFISEALEYGITARPGIEDSFVIKAPDIAEIIVSGSNFNRIHHPFIEIMKEQKRADDMEDIDNRAFIGGEIELISINKDSCSVDTIYKF